MSATKVEQSFALLTGHLNTLRQKGSFKTVVRYLEEKARPFVNQQLEQKPPTSERRLLEATHNLITSFVEGAASGDVELKDLKGLVRDISKFHTEFQEKERRLIEARAKREEAEGNALIHRSTRDQHMLPEFLPKPDRYDAAEGADEVYEKYRHYERLLDVGGNQQFVAARCPVVALTSGIPDRFKLQKTGLCDDLLFGYPVLKNQILIGFHLEFLKPYIPNWKKLERDVKNNIKTNVQLNIDWEPVMEIVSGLIKQKFNRSTIKVGPAHQWGQGRRLWVWMADARDLARLSNTTGSSTFHVNNWTVPFRNAMKTVHAKG